MNLLRGENSPSRCPTISSEPSPSTCVLPLCTPKVKPTISGATWLRRAHVLITPAEAGRIVLTFFRSLASTKGPFLSERDIGNEKPALQCQAFERTLGLGYGIRPRYR